MLHDGSFERLQWCCCHCDSVKRMAFDRFELLLHFHVGVNWGGNALLFIAVLQKTWEWFRRKKSCFLPENENKKSTRTKTAAYSWKCRRSCDENIFAVNNLKHFQLKCFGFNRWISSLSTDFGLNAWKPLQRNKSNKINWNAHFSHIFRFLFEFSYFLKFIYES